jgi:hypothetical protein
MAQWARPERVFVGSHRIDAGPDHQTMTSQGLVIGRFRPGLP